MKVRGCRQQPTPSLATPRKALLFMGTRVAPNCLPAEFWKLPHALRRISSDDMTSLDRTRSKE